MKEVLEKIKSIQKDIAILEAKIHTLNSKAIEELQKMDDIAAEVAAYIILNKYPKEIYPCFSTDPGEQDRYKNITLKVVYYYGYTDVVGLTEEEFTKLGQYLKDE